MAQKVFVYDPTASDKLSSVRGIGRYLQILQENFPDWTFSSSLTPNPYSLTPIFINPFFNFLQPPVRTNNYWSLQKRLAKKQIAVIHDLIPLKYPSHFPPGIKGSIYILLNKLALKNYDLIITDSEASKKDIIDILRLPDKKIKVIYPCLTKSFLKLEIKNSVLNENFKLKIENSFCLYVGDATWNKNLVNLAKAIKIADINCVFVGKIFENSKLKIENLNHPWQREFKQFIELTKDDKRFKFMGFVSDSDLIKLYQQSLFNILPSRDEGFGFSYLEAGNFSCPSLLSNITVLQEISDGNAIFFDPKNPQEIANKIKEIISNKILRNKIATDVKKRSKFFSADKFKREFLAVL